MQTTNERVCGVHDACCGGGGGDVGNVGGLNHSESLLARPLAPALPPDKGHFVCRCVGDKSRAWSIPLGQEDEHKDAQE